jgi:hypothetical protein
MASPPARKKTGSRILRLIFSYPVMLASLLAVLAVLTVRARFDDPDMWWHLKMGEVIWTTRHIPVTDIFSFTTNHHAWIPHEWLSQVVIFLAYKWGGFSGLMLWLCVFTAAIFIAGYLLCSLYSGNAKVSFLGGLVIFIFATVGLAVRPQMIGYLLLILELILIHLGRTRNPRWFWCLPPLFAVWINCHGSVSLGFVLAGAFLFSSFFEFRAGSLISHAWDPHSRRIFILVLIFCAVALFVNPVGVKQVLYPIDTLVHQPVGLSQVQEWQPLQLNGQRGIVFLAVLASIFLLGLVRKAELYFDELLLLVVGTWLAGSHDRMLFVFGILTAPILSRMLSTSWEGYDPETDRLLPNAVFIAAALLIAFKAFPSAGNLADQAEKNSPVKAVDFIKTHHLSGPMVNSYTFGGYLIWASPEHPVFIDGRGDVFEWTGVLQEFGQWALLQTDPNTLLDKYGIQFCLLESGSPTANVLPLLHNWKAVYSDDKAIIFVRVPGPNSLP